MDENFFKRLLATYRIEAQEHLQVMSTEIVSYEKSTSEDEKKELIENVFRAAHSLKGASRAVSFHEVEGLCKNLEYVFSALKKDELKADAKLFDLIHKAIDSIDSYLNTEDEAEKQAYKNDIISLTGMISTDAGRGNEAKPASKSSIPGKIDNGDKHSQRSIIEKTASHSSDMIRVSASKLDSLFLQSEQLMAVKLASDQTTNELKLIQNSISEWKREWNRVNGYYKKLKNQLEKKIISDAGERVEDTKFLSFIEKNNEMISQIGERLKKIERTFQNNNRAFGVMLNEVTDDLKQVLMLPYSSLSDMLPKLVRDLSRDLNKDVNLEITGSEIQADRRILEEMRDPFLHLVRNSIDHGIEPPAERIKKKKNLQGRIYISFEKLEGNNIEIIFEDDGRGIDLSAVKKRAVENEVVSKDEAGKLTESELTDLIFHSGVSTTRAITDISGHGLGLAIVKEKVEKLGGTVKVETETGKGTRFRITLPHTLSTFRGIVISCSERAFVVPVINVGMVLMVNTNRIRTVENRETIYVENIPISIVYLSDLLELGGKSRVRNEHLNVVILQLADKKAACVVDEILYEQEILVKPFNKQLARLRFISGAAVMGDGKVVPVLNVSDLLKSAERFTPAEPAEAKLAEEKKEIVHDKNILVVDDSITSRMLLKDILESAGYRVKTAIDGVDAVTALKVDKFDLIVTDIEMPRMDGFELCRIVRSDETLSRLPVVLVTALSRREDREKGINSGANAYIVKSSFDQSNLLETVKRLL